jgi:peptidoglycan hydrolase CwlO-like protein
MPKLRNSKRKQPKKNAEVRVQYDHQIQEFQSKRDEVQKKLHHLQQSSEDAWEEISQGIETAWHQLGKSFESAVSKFK